MILIKQIFNFKKRKIKFTDLAEEWLDYKKTKVKESTFYNYEYIISKYLKPYLHDFKFEDLKEFNLNNAIDKYLNFLSTKTIKDIISILKSILAYGEAKYSCCFDIDKIITPKCKREVTTVLNKKEKEIIEKYCINNGELRNIGILISLNTGLRIGEICALKWKNIDLNRQVICVRQTLERVYDKEKQKSKVIIDKPKSEKSIRDIPISSKLYKILKKLKSQYDENDYFLTGNNKKFIEPRNMDYYFERVLKKKKIGKYKFHSLRHTFATDCISVGMDAKTLSEILGHSSVDITLNIYVHSSFEIKKKFLEKL